MTNSGYTITHTIGPVHTHATKPRVRGRISEAHLRWLFVCARVTDDRVMCVALSLVSASLDEFQRLAQGTLEHPTLGRERVLRRLFHREMEWRSWGEDLRLDPPLYVPDYPALVACVERFSWAVIPQSPCDTVRLGGVG